MTSKSSYVGGSKVEVLSGTIKSHGGPHVLVGGVCSCGYRALHPDEVEIMPPELWEKSRR